MGDAVHTFWADFMLELVMFGVNGTAIGTCVICGPFGAEMSTLG
jgi:hypothetical protein